MNLPSDSALHALLRASIQLEPNADTVRACFASALDWDALLKWADTQTLTPYLYQIWQSLNLESLIPHDARAYLAQTYRDNQTRNQHARAELLNIWQLLAAHAISALVLKGLPLIDSLYTDPALRVLYDADLLVAKESHARAGLELLLARGYEPVPTKAHAFNTKHLPSVWQLNGFKRRGYLFDPAQPRPVELHLTLWDDEWRGLQIRHLENLWARSRVIQFDGIPIRVLSAEDNFIHLCVHFATHLIEREARLIQLLDLALYVKKFGDTLDWNDIGRVSESARVARFIYLALYAAHTLYGSPLAPAAIMKMLRAHTPAALRAYAEEHAGNDLRQMDYRRVNLGQAYRLTFAATESWSEKIGVLRFAFLPSSAILRAQYHAPANASRPALYARHIWERSRSYFASRGANQTDH